MTPDQRLNQIPAEHITRLTADENGPESAHRWHEQRKDVAALRLALATGRPLLLRGEPGTGKSQLARAVAAEMGWALHSAVVHARMEAQDLFAHFDAVRRLADAQAKQIKDEAHYLRPGPLWWAFDWQAANEAEKRLLDSATQNCLADSPSASPKNSPKPSDKSSEHPPSGHVVLIDEIDKADNDLANALLEVLGNRVFRLPVVGRSVCIGAQPVLILITTNEDRSLPPPFLRRCLVLDMDCADEADYARYLTHRATAHFGALPAEGEHPARAALLSDAQIAEAVSLLMTDRAAFLKEELTPPGVAELIDLLRGVAKLGANQPDLLTQLKDYAFRKHRNRDVPEQLRQGGGVGAVIDTNRSD